MHKTQCLSQFLITFDKIERLFYNKKNMIIEISVCNRFIGKLGN